MATGINAEGIKAEFLQHANDEEQHADWVATRITQLNGHPNSAPKDYSPAVIQSTAKPRTWCR